MIFFATVILTDGFPRVSRRATARIQTVALFPVINIVVFSQPCHPSDVMRGSFDRYCVWVRARIRSMVAKITQKCRTATFSPKVRPTCGFPRGSRRTTARA